MAYQCKILNTTPCSQKLVTLVTSSSQVNTIQGSALFLNSWLLSLEGLYLVTVWFEYFSITQAYRLNQKLAKQQDKIPLTSQIIVKERIGYFLEWLFGALAIWGASYLIYLGTFGFIYFIIALFPLFFIRNFLYSFVANLYYDHQQAKQLQHYQQVKNATQGDK